MSDHEKTTAVPSNLVDIFAMIPTDQLDESEIEGGLTWRQTVILAFTQGYLRIPGDEDKTPPFDERMSVRRSVDGGFRAYVAENGHPSSARDAVTFCLEVASREYEALSETSPEWAGDKEVVEGLFALWQDKNAPYITDVLAKNVLYCMYNRLSSRS